MKSGVTNLASRSVNADGMYERLIRVKKRNRSKPSWQLHIGVVNGLAAHVHQYRLRRDALAEYEKRRIALPTYELSNPWVPGTIAYAFACAVADGCNAKNPAVVLVMPGTYTENVTLYEGVTLVGSTSVPYELQDGVAYYTATG